MIEKANIQDLLEIKKLTEKCAAALIQRKIFQWNEHYPSLEKLEQDIQDQELYKFTEEGQIIGIIVLTSTMDREYEPIEWLTENYRNLYIHRLAVNPDFWGQGYAKQLMSFAEDFARKNKFQSVRLDTFSQNKRNQKFYESRGYQKLGDIFFPKQSEYPFHCYELPL